MTMNSALYVTQVEEPASPKKALKSEHAKHGKAAAHSEYQSLIENDTWDQVFLPQGRKSISSEWVLSET